MPTLDNRLWRYYRLQRWSHKTNCSNSWPGKRHSSRNSRRRKKRCRRLNAASATPSPARSAGSYIEHTTQDDPIKQDRLINGLDRFLERDQDRALFDLPPRPKDT